MLLLIQSTKATYYLSFAYNIYHILTPLFFLFENTYPLPILFFLSFYLYKKYHMLLFNQLQHLDTHIAFLQKRIKDKHTLFLVGGCVRDIILWLEKKPTDIDFTMAGEPKKLDKLIDKTGMSYFMTEKFGTMTLIKKMGKLKNKKMEDDIQLDIKYELTPLRTEGKYDDFRHPGEIERSNSLLLDSQRRDFTINCMYYTNTPYKAEYTSLIDKKNIQIYSDDETFLKRLDDHGYIFITELNTLILQDHNTITHLFAEGKFQTDHLKAILKSATIFSLWKQLKPESSKPKAVRIIIDPHKGIHDSIHKKIKAVGEPDHRFNEDALRIIRAIRFVNVLNEKLKNGKLEKWTAEKNSDKVTLFDFDKLTWNSVKKNNWLVKNVAKERIKEEIIKSFTVGNPFGFIALLDEAQLLEYLFPALYATKNIEQPIRYHPFDIYAHTLLCLFELQKINKDPLVRFAMLYHDVGKVDQFGAYTEWLSKEEIRAIIAGPLNHRRSSPEYTQKDFKTLWFSSKEITDIAWYVAHHHTPEEMIFAKEENREKKVRTFFSEAGYEKAMNVLDIAMADRLGQYNPLQNSSDLSDVDNIREILKKLQKEEWQFTMKHLVVDGGDIIKELKLPAGPVIGKLLKKTLEWVMVDIKKRNTKKEIYGFWGTQMKYIK